MLTRYCDRRRHIRIPASGPARWKSGDQTGHCELLDISPGGAGLRMPIRRATQLGPRITLEIQLSANKTWPLARVARVVRSTPGDDGTCVVGVEFASALPEDWAHTPSRQ